jgi:hypothetical protein
MKRCCRADDCRDNCVAKVLASLSSSTCGPTRIPANLSGVQDGLGIFSTALRCGHVWGHNGGILDYGTAVDATEDGSRIAVISVRGPERKHPGEDAKRDQVDAALPPGLFRRLTDRCSQSSGRPCRTHGACDQFGTCWYRSDSTWLERLHREGAVDTSPQEVAERAAGRFRTGR